MPDSTTERDTITVPEGFTLLRAEDYSALQDIAGPALAWAEADRALAEHQKQEPDGFDFPNGGFNAAFDRWWKVREPLARRERETLLSLFVAIRAALPTPGGTTEHG